MKNCIIYCQSNPLTDEQIACGMIYILDDGSSICKWSKEKVSLFMKTVGDDKKNKSGIPSLVKMNLKHMERYSLSGEKEMEARIDHHRIHGNSGLISVSDWYPFVIHKEDPQKDFDFWFNLKIENK